MRHLKLVSAYSEKTIDSLLMKVKIFIIAKSCGIKLKFNP